MTSAGPARAGAREWIGLAVLALPTMLLSMDLTVLHLAVPLLSADLKPSSSQLLWITDIYGFLVAGFLIPMGALGDRIGRRRLLLMGALAFSGASLLAAFSPSAGTLIGARAVLGLAGSTLMPSTLALIRNMFHDSAQRSVAIGVWMSSLMVGGVIGPLIGGALLDNFWWGSVFLLALPVMALLLVTGPVLLPEYRDPAAASSRLDLVSVVLSLAMVLTVIYGIKQIAENGPGWTAALSILIGLILGVLFLRRQRTLADPLLDLNLFATRTFSTAMAVMTISAVIMQGFYLFIVQYLQLVQGLSPLRAGLWLVPMIIGMLVTTMLSSVIVRHVRPAYVIGTGLLVAAAGFVTITQVGTGGGIGALVTGSVVFAIGLAPGSVLCTGIIVGAAPPERAGTASALSETSTQFGGALGLAVLGSIGVAVYRGHLAGSIPAGVPHPAAEAARGTLGGAVPVARGLPGDLGVKLLDTARAAFTEGMQITAVTCVVILLASAALAAVLLRGVPATSEEEDQSAKEKATVPEHADRAR